MSTRQVTTQAPSVARQALIALLPHMAAETARISGLLASGDRAAAAHFHALAAEAIGTHRPDMTSQGHLVPADTIAISVCRIPALPRSGKPIALFLPGLLSWLPIAAIRALAFVDLFDVVLCELPGHGASGLSAEVSLAAFAQELAHLLDTALARAPAVTLIGESLGGLVSLALAQRRPERIRNVILIDTPFQLTRPELAAWVAPAWRAAGRPAYPRRICDEIMGFDPSTGTCRPAISLHELARSAGFACAHLLGGDDPPSGLRSVVTTDDVAALHAVNPALLTPPRIERAGHAVLLDNPAGAEAALRSLLIPTTGT